MTIPSTITSFVESKNIEFEIVAHRPTQTSLESAHAAHVSGNLVAKGVLLSDRKGYLLAVLPASCELELRELERHLDTPLTLTPEAHLAEAFTDCAYGAVPALGPAYGLRTIVDRTLADAKDVYFEAGDHEELIHVSGDGFRALLSGAEFAQISRRQH